MSETLYEFFIIFCRSLRRTCCLRSAPYLRGLWMFFRRGVADMDTFGGTWNDDRLPIASRWPHLKRLLAPYLDVSATYYDVTIVVIGSSHLEVF